MGLDIGDTRCGIAISDSVGKIATPISVLPINEVVICAKSFKKLLEDWEPDLLLCGLPLSLSGEEGQQAQHVKEIADEVSKSSGLPVQFFDERLSSSDAKHYLRDLGLDEKRMRGKIDSVAASLFLQSWLDLQNS